MSESKSIHTVVLDAGPIIKNEPPVSTLLAKAEAIVTTPAVLSEIRDSTTRARVEATLRPFLQLKTPKPESVGIIVQFARKTGDVAVLSRQDIELLALAYELECERNGGNWRLRSTPGQKRTNGPSPEKKNGDGSEELGNQGDSGNVHSSEQTVPSDLHSDLVAPDTNEDQEVFDEPDAQSSSRYHLEKDASAQAETDEAESPTTTLENMAEDMVSLRPFGENQAAHTTTETELRDDASDSDSEGWITPSNIKKYQERDAAGDTASRNPSQRIIQVATISTDYALQNVLLQMNLNLLSPGLHRVRHLKTFVLRCHGCFATVKEMERQFCPRCGKPTLTRVTCTTNENGEFKLHLKKNMQWNKRGDKFSIPKPMAGASNGKVKGGGKDGWGNELILAEDQKEYERAVSEQKRTRQRDLMDEDYLPSILTGDRGRAGGRPKVGAGRNVNSRKR